MKIWLKKLNFLFFMVICAIILMEEDKMKKFFKEHDLLKLVFLVILVVVLLTWIVPSGSFATGASFTEGEFGRIGLSHIFYGFTFALQNYSIQIGFLIMIGIFYGVVSKTEGYKALVTRFAKFGKGKEIIVSLVVSFVIALLASFLNNTMILLVFIPFLVSALRHMGLDKISAFATTFGSILVGVLGATFGTDGMINFITYLGYGGSEVTIMTELAVRFGVLVLAYILFNFFNVIYLKNLLAKKKDDVKVIDDKFAVEEPKKKNTKVWPTVTMFVILFIFAVLGFVSWNETVGGDKTFGITIFEEFHEWFHGLMLGGEDGIAIFDQILGGGLPYLTASLVPEFGNWYLFTYSIILAIATILVAFVSKMSLNDFFTNVGEGFKKLIRPIMFLVLAYMVFVFLYWTPIMPTIINEFGKIASGFNPFVATLQAFVGSIFNTDFAYFGYTLSYYLGSFTGAQGNLVYLIYTTIYGLVQFVTPISVFLLFGLSYMNIPYKKWFQYIWKFFVAMLVCLLVIFTLLAYL